jgi:hypothetical protein
MAAMAVLRTYKPKPRYIPKNAKHEQSLQRQVCTYLRMQYPNVIFRSDFSSGLHLTPAQASLHKSMQSGRAWPDLQIINPSRKYHGLFIELKKEGTKVYLKNGKLTSNPHIQEQAAVLKELNKLGYFARFGIGFDSCQRLIDWYLNPNYTKSENTELF